MERARQVLSGEKRSREVGCRGPPMFISEHTSKSLFYLSADSFFIIPIAHCLLYGLVRSLAFSFHCEILPSACDTVEALLPVTLLRAGRRCE